MNHAVPMSGVVHSINTFKNLNADFECLATM